MRQNQANQGGTNGASDIVTLDAVELARRIKTREISCRQVMEAYLDHIERFNPLVNAIVSQQETELLLTQADERDGALARGEYLGWMHGLPQAVKDLTQTAGITTTFGSPVYARFVPAADALMVTRMKRSGAILIGKTNTPEFGLGSQTYNQVFGATLNAYDTRKTSGGSSGGAAVALALRMLPVADGSDMMGSLRNPAAFNNVFGMRPSFGRVPNAPAPDVFMHQLGTAGPMARTVTDLAMLLSVQAGFDEQAPLSLQQDPSIFTGSLERDFKGARIGWLGDLDGYLAMEPGITALCESALKDLESIGCTVERAMPEFALPRLWDAWLVLRQWQVAGGPAGDIYRSPEKRAALKPEAIWEIEAGLQLTAHDVYKASATRSAWYQAVRKLFERYDYLALPSAQVFPFDADLHWPREINGRAMDTYHRWMEVVVPASMSGCPAINVPVGFNDSGLPMGLQIIGKAQADLAVLQIAYAYEQATQWVQKRPPPMLSLWNEAQNPRPR
jgi:amidase